MSQFSVIDNSSLPNTLTPATPRLIEAGDARALITDRPWHIAGKNDADAASTIHPNHSGIFLTGQRASVRAATLRRQHPGTPMIVEPRATTHYWADEDAPFALADRSGNFDTNLPLEAMLDQQRAAGDPIAMTPTGQIRVGESETLKAVIESANDLDRDDVLVSVPLAANWLSQATSTDQVIRVLDRSRHPVALSFTDGISPLGSMKRMRAHRRLVATTTAEVLAYRIDLNGLDALAQGAMAAAIGAYPTKRRLDPVPMKPKTGGPQGEVLSPQMLIPDMLRIMPSMWMRNTWFLNAPSFACSCAVCDGDAIDRLHESDLERALGHRHNVLGFELLLDTMLAVPRANRPATWASLVAGAIDTYPQLEAHLGRPLKIPNDLGVWASPVT